MFSKKFEAISKERTVHSTSTTDTAQDAGYHSDDTKEFPTIAEWFAEKDEFRVVGVGHARPFPLVSQVSSNKKLVIYDLEHLARHLSKNLAAHNIPLNSIAINRRLYPGGINQSNQEHDIEILVISTTAEIALHWKDAVM